MCAVILDCSEGDARDDAVAQAAEVVRAGKLLVMPTDTVYGIGADAFDNVAVAMVLAAKHRSRDMPPPVLVPSPRTVDGLATNVSLYAKMLMRAFWPGPLTLVFQAQRSLAWDLGHTNGTVALRMPSDDVALEVLSEVGPMAVTSANLTGRPAATSAQQAHEQLGGSVALYLDDGPRNDQGASTIVDCTGPEPVVLRHGSLDGGALREVLGDIELHDEPPTPNAVPDGVVVEGDLPDSSDHADPVTPAQRSTTPESASRGIGAARLVGTVQPCGVVARRSAVLRLKAPSAESVPPPPTVESAAPKPVRE